MDLEQTQSWETVPETWACPGCIRRRNDCEVTAKDGRKLRHLVEHHDHMRGYVKDYLIKQYGPWHTAVQKHLYPREFARHVDLIKQIAQRFPHTLVCLDCNDVEGKIKKSIAADRYFSFHPAELHRALMPAANQRHVFVVEHMPLYRELYEEVHERLVLKRKQTIRSLVDSAARDSAAWGGPIDLERVLSKDAFERLGREYPSFDSSRRLKDGLEQGKAVFRGASWQPHEEAELRRMASEGANLDEIARLLGRTPTGVRYRMEKLGLFENSKQSS